MARSRRRRTTTQRAAGLIALALPAPIQRIADTHLGSLLMLVGVPALFVFGWLHVTIVDGFPTFSLDGRKTAEFRRATSQHLNELEHHAAQQNLGVFADVLHTIQGPNHSHNPAGYSPVQQPLNTANYLTPQQQQQQLLQRQAYEQSVYQQQQNQRLYQQQQFPLLGNPQSSYPQQPAYQQPANQPQAYTQPTYQQSQSYPQSPAYQQPQYQQPQYQSQAQQTSLQSYTNYGQNVGQGYPVPVHQNNLPSTSQYPYSQSGSTYR